MKKDKKPYYNYRQTIAHLKYFADSPAPGYGGFSQLEVFMAKSALFYFKKLAKTKLKEAKK